MATSIRDTGIIGTVSVPLPRPVPATKGKGRTIVRPGAVAYHAGQSPEDARAFGAAILESWTTHHAAWLAGLDVPASGRDETAYVTDARTGERHYRPRVQHHPDTAMGTPASRATYVPTRPEPMPATGPMPATRPARARRTRAASSEDRPMPAATVQASPAEVRPTCDLCHGPDLDGGPADWNAETGNHASCEEYRDRPADPEPMPAAIRPHTARTAEPCPRCARVDWRSADGRAWHLANYPACADAPRQAKHRYAA